jgi:hypothetical protein
MATAIQHKPPKFHNRESLGTRLSIDWGTQENTATITAGAEKKRLIATTKEVTKELLKLFVSEWAVGGTISGRMRDKVRRASPSLEGLGLKSQIALARGLLFPIFADPGLPALSGSRIPAGEGKCRDIGIGNFHFLRGILGKNSHKTGGKGRTGRPIEQITFDF